MFMKDNNDIADIKLDILLHFNCLTCLSWSVCLLSLFLSSTLSVLLQLFPFLSFPSLFPVQVFLFLFPSVDDTNYKTIFLFFCII